MTEQTTFEEGELDRIARDYRADGYVVVPSPFEAAEVSAFGVECERLAEGLARADVEDPRIQSRGHRERGVVRDRYDPVTDFSPLFRDLVADPRVRAIAAAAVGAEPVPFKDRLILKSAGTEGYDLHLDWPYWEWMGIPPDEMVTLMVSVDATDASNGAVEVFPGLHRSSLPPSPDEPRDLDPRAVDGLTGRMAATGAGDILLLHPMAPHRSGPNLSGGSRRIAAFVYASDRHPGARERYYAGYADHR
ncbi:MAG TPA: phytanoyl-CoA dioxygenase family protein [Gemmatimonadota bacterium]|nr:phytanoyl-CoA dioxygenase family protein [Gemmatimonadota bacterium]